MTKVRLNPLFQDVRGKQISTLLALLRDQYKLRPSTGSPRSRETRRGSAVGPDALRRDALQSKGHAGFVCNRIPPEAE